MGKTMGTTLRATVLGLALALLAGAGPAAAQTVKWKLGSAVGPQDATTLDLQKYAAAVKERDDPRPVPARPERDEAAVARHLEVVRLALDRGFPALLNLRPALERDVRPAQCTCQVYPPLSPRPREVGSRP